MRRFIPVCTTLAALSLVASQQARAGDDRAQVIGTYAWTMAEGCVQQVTLPLTNPKPPPQYLPAFGPAFSGDSNFNLLDPLGGMTYGGAVEGLFVFDGHGGVINKDGQATTIHNADSSYVFPPPAGDQSYLTPGKIPLGFGFGPALPFICSGPGGLGNNYTVKGGKIAVNLFCTATVDATNPGNDKAHNPFYPNVFTGFSTVIQLKGILPRDPSHLVLTDIGELQPITIFVNGGASKPGGMDIPGNRVCARSAVLELVSGPEDR